MIKALDLYISFKDILRINEAAKNFIEYFKQIVKDKKSNPDDGVVSKLVQLNKQENVLHDDELISTCILLFIAGEETSIGLMSTGLYNLLNHPEVIEQLRSNPSKIPGALEELLRYDSPVQIVGRIAGKDVMMGGKQIKAGDPLTICLGSANRDSEIFEKPDEFLLDRADNKHIAFGGGAHYCLGDWLARIQTQLMIETILDRFKKIEMLDAEPDWNNSLAIRTLTKLPVKIS
jgi:cytochrome P450